MAEGYVFINGYSQAQTTEKNNIAKTKTNINKMFLWRFLVLSLFTVVRFNNDGCVTGTGVNGTCYSSTECSTLQGKPSGSCASGFGVCCLCKLGNNSFLIKVKKNNKENVTTFVQMKFIWNNVIPKRRYFECR